MNQLNSKKSGNVMTFLLMNFEKKPPIEELRSAFQIKAIKVVRFSPEKTGDLYAVLSDLFSLWREKVHPSMPENFCTPPTHLVVLRDNTYEATFAILKYQENLRCGYKLTYSELGHIMELLAVNAKRQDDWMIAISAYKHLAHIAEGWSNDCGLKPRLDEAYLDELSTRIDQQFGSVQQLAEREVLAWEAEHFWLRDQLCEQLAA